MLNKHSRCQLCAPHNEWHASDDSHDRSTAKLSLQMTTCQMQVCVLAENCLVMRGRIVQLMFYGRCITSSFIAARVSCSTMRLELAASNSTEKQSPGLGKN